MKKTLILSGTLTLALLGFASAAQARHPSHHEMRRVKSLAHELSESSRYLYDHGSSTTRHASRYERDALYDLHALAKASHHFYRQADRYYGEPYHTEADFRDLVHAYHEARAGFHYLGAYRHYRGEFRNLVRVMDDLVGYYGGYSAYERHRSYGRGHGGRSGSYGHDRPGYYRYERRGHDGHRGHDRHGGRHGHGGHYQGGHRPSDVDKALHYAEKVSKVLYYLHHLDH